LLGRGNRELAGQGASERAANGTVDGQDHAGPYCTRA
jgi:hypothetical protein